MMKMFNRKHAENIKEKVRVMFQLQNMTEEMKMLYTGDKGLPRQDNLC